MCTNNVWNGGTPGVVSWLLNTLLDVGMFLGFLGEMQTEIQNNKGVNDPK